MALLLPARCWRVPKMPSEELYLDWKDTMKDQDMVLEQIRLLWDKPVDTEPEVVDEGPSPERQEVVMAEMRGGLPEVLRPFVVFDESWDGPVLRIPGYSDICLDNDGQYKARQPVLDDYFDDEVRWYWPRWGCETINEALGRAAEAHKEYQAQAAGLERWKAKRREKEALRARLNNLVERIDERLMRFVDEEIGMGLYGMSYPGELRLRTDEARVLQEERRRLLERLEGLE